METSQILTKYGKYYDAIKKIGSYPLKQPLQLSDLGETKEMKAISQKCYNDINKIEEMFGDHFKLTVIDYVCLVSTWYLKYVILKDSKIPQEDMTPEKYAREIVRFFFSYKEETKNLLRLFVKNPMFLMSQITESNFSRKKTRERVDESQMKSFQIVGGLWFVLSMMEEYADGVREKYWEYQTTKGFISKIISTE